MYWTLYMVTGSEYQLSLLSLLANYADWYSLIRQFFFSPFQKKSPRSWGCKGGIITYHIYRFSAQSVMSSVLVHVSSNYTVKLNTMHLFLQVIFVSLASTFSSLREYNHLHIRAETFVQNYGFQNRSLQGNLFRIELAFEFCNTVIKDEKSRL